jgi:hypothetical protein
VRQHADDGLLDQLVGAGVQQLADGLLAQALMMTTKSPVSTCGA